METNLESAEYIKTLLNNICYDNPESVLTNIEIISYLSCIVLRENPIKEEVEDYTEHAHVIDTLSESLFKGTVKEVFLNFLEKYEYYDILNNLKKLDVL